MITTLRDILFVLVTYNKKIRDSTALENLNEYITRVGGYKADVLVYDNSHIPDLANINDFQELNIILVSSSENNGVGAAYNMGAEIAGLIGKRWMIFLDQDTELPFDFIGKYLSAIKKHPSVHVFTSLIFSNGKNISPFKFKFAKRLNTKNLKKGIVSFEERGIINSTLCVSYQAFVTSGGYEERLKLDYSDVLFFKKLSKNYPVFVQTGALCTKQFTEMNKTLDYALARFAIFCNDSLIYASITSKKTYSFILVFNRMLRLIFRYKSAAFLKIFRSDYLRKEASKPATNVNWTDQEFV